MPRPCATTYEPFAAVVLKLEFKEPRIRSLCVGGLGARNAFGSCKLQVGTFGAETSPPHKNGMPGLLPDLLSRTPCEHQRSPWLKLIQS